MMVEPVGKGEGGEGSVAMGISRCVGQSVAIGSCRASVSSHGNTHAAEFGLCPNIWRSLGSPLKHPRKPSKVLNPLRSSKVSDASKSKVTLEPIEKRETTAKNLPSQKRPTATQNLPGLLHPWRSSSVAGALGIHNFQGCEDARNHGEPAKSLQ